LIAIDLAVFFETAFRIGATAILMESKLYDAQGQYFFWEPVNNDIPETGLSQPGKLTGYQTTYALTTNSCDPKCGTESPP
jgi:hypothetical protein